MFPFFIIIISSALSRTFAVYLIQNQFYCQVSFHKQGICLGMLILLSRKYFSGKQNNLRAACGSIQHLTILPDWKAMRPSPDTT